MKKNTKVIIIAAAFAVAVGVMTFTLTQTNLLKGAFPSPTPPNIPNIEVPEIVIPEIREVPQVEDYINLHVTSGPSKTIEIDWNDETTTYTLGEWNITVDEEMTLSNAVFSIGLPELNLVTATNRSQDFFQNRKIKLQGPDGVVKTFDQETAENVEFSLPGGDTFRVRLVGNVISANKLSFLEQELEGKEMSMMVLTATLPDGTVYNMNNTDNAIFFDYEEDGVSITRRATYGGTTLTSKEGSMIVTPSATLTQVPNELLQIPNTAPQNIPQAVEVDTDVDTDAPTEETEQNLPVDTPPTEPQYDTNNLTSVEETTVAETTTPTPTPTPTPTDTTVTYVYETYVYTYTDDEAPISENAEEIIISPTYVCSDPFVDTNGYPEEDLICRLYSAGVVRGRDASHYVPSDQATRAEFLKVLLREQGFVSEDFNGMTEPYSDVRSGDWYQSYIAGGFTLGIISNSDIFRPNDPITRGEAATMMARASGLTLSTSNNPFTDVIPTTFYGPAVITLANTEVETAYGEEPVLRGYDDGTFKPHNYITRNEMASMVFHSFDLMFGRDVI
ncbi:S-layer homology domain-containing protein [Patescibacteria group bacterium]|nr:S-layer homology domain-containing protein [Patescibacteria group bacterium]